MDEKKKTGRPAKHSPKLLCDVLNAMLRPYTGLEEVAKKHKVSVQALFRYQKQSAEDEFNEVADSPFLIDYLGTRSFYHRHLAFVRAIAVARIDHRIIEAATSPTKEFLFNAQTGAPHWVVDPKIAADAKSMSDAEWSLEYGNADIERDRTDIFKRDATGALIQATREMPPQPALLIKAAASLLSSTYGERVAHTHMIGGVVRIGSEPPSTKRLAPPPTFQVLDADFTPVEDEKPLEPTNVLMVADEPETVEEYERTFGGKRLVEAILFYAEDKTLLAPLPEIVIVEGSSIHRAYREAGIEVDTVPASRLLAQGFCNDFLLAMASPKERELAGTKLKEPIKNKAPLPLPTVEPEDAPVKAVKDTRVSKDPFMNVDGSPKPGGFRVDIGAPPQRRRTVI
jgi:hypothetical protein